MIELVVWQNHSGCRVCSCMRSGTHVHPRLHSLRTPDSPENCPVVSFSQILGDSEAMAAVAVLRAGRWL